MTRVVVETSRAREIIDVTERVADAVSLPEAGLLSAFLTHTSAALLVTADDAELRRDVERVAERWLASSGPFEHRQEGNPNAEAHVLSAFGGVHVLVPIADGRLVLGRYQRLLMLELDGPGERTIVITTLSSPPAAVAA